MIPMPEHVNPATTSREWYLLDHAVDLMRRGGEDHPIDVHASLEALACTAIAKELRIRRQHVRALIKEQEHTNPG